MSADLFEQAVFCPRCGERVLEYLEGKYWQCPSCAFTYYHNVAASASVILEINGAVLMVVRGRDPGKGQLSLPGGFVDPLERAEDAARRECREEINIDPGKVRFVGSWPNVYRYREITYYTCDLVFAASLSGPLADYRPDGNENTGIILLPLADIETAPIAFPSIREALLAYRDASRQADQGL